MAISSGSGPHRAWLTVGGGQFPIQHGTVDQHATRKSSTFSATIPMSYPGAYQTFSNLGENTTAILVTTRGATNTLITGEIDSVDIDYVRTLISVTGRDQSAKLHAKKSAEKWTNKKGSEIVQELAGRVGLGVQVDASLLMAGKKLTQEFVKLSDGISFAAVIHKLAELDGARWWVKNGTLHYQLSSNPSGSFTLNYVAPQPGQPMRADFLDLRIRRNIQAGKNVKVTVKSWHPRKKQVYEGQAEVGGNGGSSEYVYHIPNLTQEHAQRHAKSRADDHARHALTLTATCVGDPSIDVAMALQLSGTNAFDRQYQMDCVHHDFGMRGHTMTITAKLPTGAGT
jgi:phage protein D